MTFQGLDLVYECQVELGWDQSFASTALREYKRWLQLRTKIQDYHGCKLAPSRVVALIWNLHRQWTLDYERMCTSLGGYLHHYPPSMRMSFTREQAYATTYYMYKTHFEEDPPVSHWGLPVCPHRPNTVAIATTIADAADQQAVDRPVVPQYSPRCWNVPSGRVPKNPKRKRNNMSSNNNHPSTITTTTATRCNMLMRTRTPTPTPTPMPRPTPTPTTPKASVIMHPFGSAINSQQVGQKKRRKSFTSNLLQQGYVLRPLPPGEKRKRGRPSRAEYIQSPPCKSEHLGVDVPTSPDFRVPEATAATAATAAAARAARGADVEMCKDGSSGSRTSIVPVLPQLGGKGAGDGQKMDEGMNFEATAITAPAKRPRGRPRKDGGRRVEERASKKSSDLETGIIRMAHVAAAAAAVATVAASVEDEESEEEEEEVRRRALGSK